jgi:hypothetical protein
MSESALEFVETWVEEKIEDMGETSGDVQAQAKALAAECIAAAQEDGITQSEINDTFDDLAAFIAGEIEEAAERKHRPDEGTDLVDEDDARFDEEDDDEDDKDEDGDDDEKDEEEKDDKHK